MLERDGPDLEHDATELMPIRNQFKISDPLLKPEEDLEKEATQKQRSRLISRVSERRFEGWKFTIFCAFIASLVVLFFNIGFLLYCVVHPKHDAIDLYSVKNQDAYRETIKHQLSTILYEGECDTVHHLSIGFHLLINVLSTALLSASNFGMQCLAAPTRQNIDRRHPKGHWFDIGVPSVHNLSNIPGKRLCLWLCLAFSSLPFHLMYNSAIYSTTSATAYDIFAGPSSLAQKNLSSLSLIYPSGQWGMDSSFQELYSAARNGSLTRLNNSGCIDAFGVTFQTAYKKLWVVTDDIKENDTYSFVYENPVFSPLFNTNQDPSPYAWLCDGWSQSISSHCKRASSPEIQPRTATDDWTLSVPNAYNTTEYRIQYCMAEKKEQSCKLQYSFPLTIVVIVFNLVKTSVLAYMWFGISTSPILTIGDAIASFLHRPDPHSQNGCLLTSRDVKEMYQRLYTNLVVKPLHQPRAFEDTPRRWSTAASARRWIFSILLWVLAIIVCLILLIYGLHAVGENANGTSPWSQSLGSSNSRTLINGDSWPTSLISNVMIANSPQLIFSFLYFAFNGLLIAMTLATEWSGYAKHRKGLRVSNNPRGAQRTNYFLSIPYRFSIPLLVISTLLHWLISQSLFMVGVEGFGTDGLRDPSTDFVTCGWSPVGIVCAVVVGVVMFSCLLWLSQRRFDSAMPVASSCSLAIAAACHPTFDPNFQGGENRGGAEDVDSEEEEEDDMSLLPVQWGAIPVHGSIGHCSFTSGDVEMPQKGEVVYQ